MPKICSIPKKTSFKMEEVSIFCSVRLIDCHKSVATRFKFVMIIFATILLYQCFHLFRQGQEYLKITKKDTFQRQYSLENA